MRFLVKNKQIAAKKRCFMVSIFSLLIFLIGLMTWTIAAEAAPLHIKTVISAYKTEKSSYRASHDELSHPNGGGPGWPGLRGPRGWMGLQGPRGTTGSTGLTGATGAAGGISGFADFYALMPPDNAATVVPGTDVSFPQNGPTSGTTIARTSSSTFNLSAIGTYQVLFQVSVNEAGQLILTLNGTDLAYTVVGRATGTSQIVEMALVTTTSLNSILTVRNPAGNSTALTITPIAGGTRSVSAHLVITQLQ